MGGGVLGEDDDAARAAVEAVDGVELAGVAVLEELGKAAPAGFGDRNDALGFIDGEVIVRLEEDPDGGPRRWPGHFFLKGFLSSLSRACACSSAVSGMRSGSGSRARIVSRVLRASSIRPRET